MFHFLLWNSFSHGTPGVSQAHGQNVNDSDTHAHPRWAAAFVCQVENIWIWSVFFFLFLSTFPPTREAVEDASL